MRDVRCSFCDKMADEVDRMVRTSTKPKAVAPNRYEVSIKAAICDGCLALCAEELDEGSDRRRPASKHCCFSTK